MTLTLDLTADPDPDELALLGGNLTAFNAGEVGPAGRQPLAIFVRGGEGKVEGGLSGYTAWGWLYVQWLWIAEAHRGQGLSGRLLAMAEAEARDRGCHGAYIDTFNPSALAAYSKAGYSIFGELPDFPRGRTRYFLSKAL
ncbi:acetyltransferase [Devosia geojensis]|uniref:Acetyltransferase n=1 Tax=Devosia geojensis TaxID=443610 RepID=A0A0F5FE94_9HYPH|nr:GNAT family N-acetyltransferase [Devosia geojensis]KKB07098.1 acetyltransferase [Devosia geojensis]